MIFSFGRYLTRTIFLLAVFMAFFCAYPVLDSRAGTEDNIARIQKAYEHFRDLSGDFVQTSVLKDLDRTDTYRGEFFIKPPLRMKWLYKGKAAQDVTINGDTVLIYKKKDNQAYRGKFDRSTYGQTPVALLSGFGNIRREFNVTGKDNTLVLRPRKSMGTITYIEISLSAAGFPIRSFIIHDTYSNVITIELKNVRTNAGIKDSLFDLTVPKGANVYEQ
jgi:outer membrane lipoprotein carrier protein